ncbi:MAG: hypothetical protein H7256_01740 [Bdellovibrio sp.]|nr:hypothetical protein [Bdellovibrio sp.]
MKKSFTVTKVVKNKKGQGLIEYLILVALIAVGTVGVVSVVGQNVRKQYANINKSLGAKDQEKQTMAAVDSDKLTQKNLSDFMDSATARKTGGKSSGQSSNNE